MKRRTKQNLKDFSEKKEKIIHIKLDEQEQFIYDQLEKNDTFWNKNS